MEAVLGFINELALKYPLLGTILMVLGIVLVVAQIVVPLTPTLKDDKFLAKIRNNAILSFLFNLFLSFAPVQKNKDGAKLSSK